MLFLREAFRIEGEGSSGCKRGEKKKVSVVENEVNTAGVPLNKNGKWRHVGASLLGQISGKKTLVYNWLIDYATP